MRKVAHLLSIKGISLLEIVVALALLAIFVAAFTPLIVNSYEAIMWSGEKSVAVYEKQEQMEAKIISDAYNTTGIVRLNGGAPVNVKVFEDGSLKYFILKED